MFLHGIPGIGKSELAKAYARRYEKEYTNILYIPYDGSLWDAIIDLDFADDLPDEDEKTRFKRHNRLLKSLKEDTLLIIDNFNEADDPRLAMLLGYRCRILITTRNRFEDQTCLELQELDEDALLRLVQWFYGEAAANRAIVAQIADAVHRHTFAVELAARLLESGLLDPDELLAKLQAEKTGMDAADKIRTAKDGRKDKATYHDHIRTLFALFRLSPAEQDILRNMSLMPMTGIPIRLFALWLRLDDGNGISDLVERGLIQPVPGRQIAMHPMIREVAAGEFSPSVRSCSKLVDALHQTCLFHGIELSYNKWLFQAIEGVMAGVKRDDLPAYLLFLEDAFFYMHKYQYISCMNQIVAELTGILADPAVGTIRDRALLLQCRFARESDPAVGVQYLEEAVDLLPEITKENAAMLSNLHCNMGQCHLELQNVESARFHMEEGIRILEDFGEAGYHDSVVQIINYANFQVMYGEPQRGYMALKKLARFFEERNHTQCDDYATILFHLCAICGKANRFRQAEAYLRESMAIYEQIYAACPERLEEQREIFHTTAAILKTREQTVNF